jgi:hypothetical protein
MVTMPEGYYSHFNADDQYEQVLYRAGRVVQGRELNETQEAINDRVRRIADVLFKDGAVIRDAQISIGLPSGLTSLGAGVIYARGAMRGVGPYSVTIPVLGLVVLGVYLQNTVITELENPDLRDPAIDVRNTQLPGAARLKVEAVWGVAGDGTPGDFFPVYTVQDGSVLSTAPPPAVDAIGLSIASYDRDSTGGYYVVEGLQASMLPDEAGKQMYSLAAGNARVNGSQVLLQHARRIAYAATPDLKQVLAEPHYAVGGTERIDVSRLPIASVDQVIITTQKTVDVRHGPNDGFVDALPDGSVAAIVAVNQGGTWNGSAFVGGTTYVQGTDYILTSDSVNWAAAGVSEPAPNSLYKVVYRYNTAVSPTAVDETGFTVTGAVPATTISVSYRWCRPRIDRLCLDNQGAHVWVEGVPNDTTPRPPAIPLGLLPVASVQQTWRTSRSMTVDGTRVQSMQQISSLEDKVDNLFAVVSEQMLKTDAALSDPSTKRGIFTDNFIDDDLRDKGTAQNGAIINGALTLPATGVNVLTVNLGATQTLPLNTAGTYPVISQTLRTGCMAVNPYMAFEPIPAKATIAPATDFWTESLTVWTSPTTEKFTSQREVVDRFSSVGWLTRVLGVTTDVVVNTTTELASSRTVDIQTLRQIVITFTLDGFGPGENLTTVLFDGISVSFTA